MALSVFINMRRNYACAIESAVRVRRVIAVLDPPDGLLFAVVLRRGPPSNPCDIQDKHRTTRRDK